MNDFKDELSYIKVSVIVPAYNSEHYIAKCLDSLITQTLEEIEIIVINDGSEDNTLKIISDYAKVNNKIKVLSQSNQGPSAARNEGLKIAKGTYISFVDSDDFVDKNYFETLYTSATENNCDVVVSALTREHRHRKKYRLNFDKPEIYNNLSDKIKACDIPNCCYACGKLYHRDLIQGYEFKSGVYFEDMLWLPEVIKKSDKLMVNPKVCYHYIVNNNSIVKKRSDKKKQSDLYNARIYIKQFFNSNGLAIPQKYNLITKRTITLFGIPILKISASDNQDIYALFGLIPFFKKSHSKFKKTKKLFLFKKIDSHYILELFGISIRKKYKTIFKIEEPLESGVMQEKRTPALIVSLTSFPDRIASVHKTIKTLLTQTIKPDRVILWLAEEQFQNKEKDLPDTLLKMKDFGLEIRWCEDLRSYKKLVPALNEFPNDIIVTADDDLYYQKDWLESLYKAFIKNPEAIHTRRACYVEYNKNCCKLTPFYYNSQYAPSYCNQLMGGAGTLYPPNSLHKDIFNKEKFLTLTPTFDDIYFWAMAVINGKKINMVQTKDNSLYTNNDVQSCGLCKVNRSYTTAFENIFNEYPQILSIINTKGK